VLAKSGLSPTLARNILESNEALTLFLTKDTLFFRKGCPFPRRRQGEAGGLSCLRLLGVLGERIISPFFGHFDEKGLMSRSAGCLRQSNALGSVVA
jgi:hypothetical protein